jgi:hypothetical protein
VVVWKVMADVNWSLIVPSRPTVSSDVEAMIEKVA